MRHQRSPLPKILTVSVTAALPIRRGERGGGGEGAPDATRILGSTWCLRSFADLFKGFDLSFRSPTENRCANSLLASNKIFLTDQLTNASRVFKYNVIVTVMVKLFK